MNKARADATYTMGRTDAETERLIKQSRLYDLATRRLFEDAGLSPGMKVLDVGTGAGDVALLAADLVGPAGQIVGVDVNEDILRTAQTRAHAAGLEHVSFVAGDARTAPLPDDFDAIVGRLVLMYMADPGQALRCLARHVRPGGILAFQEMDFTIGHAFAAAGYMSAFGEQVWTWLLQVFTRSGAHAGMGFDLHRAFCEAGLGAPEMALHAPVGGGRDWPGYDYTADSFRSFLPLLERYDIATATEVDVDTLAARIFEEVERTQRPIFLVPVVGAWVRKVQ